MKAITVPVCDWGQDPGSSKIPIDLKTGANFILTSTVRYGTTLPMDMVVDNREAVDERPSARQQEVLSVVLDLMVELGDGFSMAAVAKRAKCSKETLYRWFGDRDGLLTSTVQWQASKVVMPALEEDAATAETFKDTLCSFAESWLTVLTGEVSVALNRLAVSHAGSGNSNLGQIVLKHGPFAMRERLLPIFALGRDKGFLDIEADDAFGLFFGLVVRDVQIRVLLGDIPFENAKQLSVAAEQAVEQFLLLCRNEIDHRDTGKGVF